MNAALIVLLALVAIGVVASPLLRMRAWLRKSPPSQEFLPPPEERPE